MSIACFKIRKWRATFIWQSHLCWWMWLVQSVFERAVVVGGLSVVSWESDSIFLHVNWCETFQAWIWCEIFHTWNFSYMKCEFSIRHVQPCSTCEVSNLHTFWCESGMKHAWSYENILYGCARLCLSCHCHSCQFRPVMSNHMYRVVDKAIRVCHLAL